MWKKAHLLTLAVYRATEEFPRSELFGLTSQLRRSAASIGANLAEGSGRRGDGDFGRFIAIAIGSASEVEYHILLARDLGYLRSKEYQQLETMLREVGRMLSALALAVQQTVRRGRNSARSQV